MNKFKKFLKSFCLLFMCAMCALLCACSGVETEDDDYQFGLSMDNVKVLRRSYGDDRASAAAISESYYDNYVSNLFTYLTNIYGNVNNYFMAGKLNIFNEISTEFTSNTKGLFDEIPEEILTTVADLDSSLRANSNDFIYFYDAMRYQITEEIAYYVPKWKKDIGGGNFEYSDAATQPSDFVANTTEFTTPPIAMSPTYYKVTADRNLGWNWGLNYELGTGLDKADVFLNVYPGSTTAGSTITAKISAENYSYNSGVNQGFYGYYGANVYSSQDEYDYISFNKLTYSNAIYNPSVETVFEKALTYVVYSIVNNKTPANITVNKTNTGNTFTVEGYSSLDNALASAKQEYVDNAAYIGLTKTDQEKLVKYILDNVIGSEAVEFANSTDATDRYDLHYEEMVAAIVSYCTALTLTGQTTAENGVTILNQTYIGGQYLSSDIVDYAYASAYVNGDALGFLEFAHLGEFEYQSMMLMPKEDAKIDEIWLDFGYVGNGGKNDSIKIRTYIRNYVGNGEFVIYTKDIEVKEGIVDVGEDGTTLCFDFSDTNDKYIQCDKIDFDEAIHSDRYKKRVEAGGIINPLVLLEKNSIVISNTTDARNYYSLVEGEYRDYGVFNHNMLTGEVYEKGHYIEIAFEVISATTNNYKFNCGLSLVNEYIEKDLSQYQ